MLETVVEESLALHGGGTSYFDHLDEQLRRPEFFEALTDAVVFSFGYLPPLVVTGKFGDAYRQWWTLNIRRYDGPNRVLLRFDGGLRYKSITAVPGGLVPSGYVFLDDSFYRGRTFSKVAAALFEGGSRVVGSFVIYDGSSIPGIAPDFALYTYRTSTVKGQ